MNPVRAGMVQHLGEYRWSSYGVNGQSEKSKLIKPHPLYTELGETDETRAQGYRALFQAELDPGEIDEIRKATNGNFSPLKASAPT
ncbi:MAG: hypothetical protein D3922_07215 [Candidatus Electrothrix sp. AR1]|nr:hypothetical protein [Candidatus Electrothrix sp. AR1]